MKVMVIVKATASSEGGTPPSAELLEAMTQYNEALVNAGIILSGDGLKPSKEGVRVHFSGNNRSVSDGPFTETKELIAGYWLWRVNSMDEAIEWVKKCPNPMPEDSEIEIRPLFEPEDFGEAFTPELREREATLVAQSVGLNPPSFETGNKKSIVGIEQNYTFETRSNITQQWESFISIINNIDSQNSGITYGICTSMKENGFSYLSGVEASNDAQTPENMVRIELPPQRYAVFTHTQHVSLIAETIDKIWGQWLPNCPLKAAEGPSFERYTPEFDSQSGMNGIEIWIPIETNL